MTINGKVHCVFEQSGTFKREFIKLGIPAEDYDIQDNFGETDHVMDLFHEIEEAYRGGRSVFDTITPDDLIMAFFPCIKFCSVMENAQHEDFYDRTNLQALCDECNHLKGQRDKKKIQEWKNKHKQSEYEERRPV